jgi:hypothetical protein
MTTQDEEIARLRCMLAQQIAGHLLYADDGELQDNTTHPWIDFKRDTIADIVLKLDIRAREKLASIAAKVPHDWKAQHLRRFFTLDGKTVFAYDKDGIDYLMGFLEGCQSVVHDNKTGG